MDATLALIIVGILVLAALVAAAGGFARIGPSRRRTVVRERPVERVVDERPPATEERTVRRTTE